MDYVGQPLLHLLFVFEKPSQYGNLTAKNVADYMGIGYDDGGTNSEAKEALEHYLGSPYVPTIKNAILTQEQIKTAIDNIDPAFMQCRRPNGFLSYKISCCCSNRL